MELKSFQEEAVSLVQVSTQHNAHRFVLIGTTILQEMPVKAAPQGMELIAFSVLKPSALPVHTLQTLFCQTTLSVVSMFLQIVILQTVHRVQLCQDHKDV